MRKYTFATVLLAAVTLSLSAQNLDPTVEVRRAYDDVEVIDSFFQDSPHDARPLWFLGKSLELLSTADLAVFANGWSGARGCIIEHECCLKYGIEIFNED